MKYLNTSDELLFESLLSESIVYYSPELREALNRLKSKNPIAQDLADLEGQDIESDLTFLDFGTEGYLTFQQMPKAMKLIKAEWPDASDANIDVKFDRRSSDILYNNDKNNYRFTGVWKGNRNQVKIGKVINKSLPGKYTESEIENFVNSLKVAQTYRGELKLVQGEEINHWYKSENYESLNGSLGSSCMKDSNDLKIYVRNPDVCKMLILVRDGKLAARALVWKLYSSTIPGRPEWFMDRVYVCKDADYQLLREEAAKRGWALRTRTSSSGYTEATYKGQEYDDIEMEVKVRPGDYKTYPYLDTFKRYVPRTGMLYNDERYSGADGIILTSTQGSFSQTRRDQGLFRRMASNLRDRVNPIPVIEKSHIKTFEELNFFSKIKKSLDFKYRDTFSDEEYMQILEHLQINNLVKLSIVRDEKDRNKKIEVFFGSQTRSSLSPQYLLITKLNGEYRIIGHIEVHQFAEYDEENRPTLKKYKTVDEVISECKRRLLIMLIATYVVKKFGNIETLHDIRWNRIQISEEEYQEAESLINDYSVYSSGKVNFKRLELLVSEELGEEAFQKDDSVLDKAVRKKPIYSEIESDVGKLFK